MGAYSPSRLINEKLDKKILNIFGLKEKNKANLSIWKNIITKINFMYLFNF